MAQDNEIKNVFVSHYHEDEQHVKNLKALMGDKYEFRNSSVTSDKFNRANNPDYIKNLLRPLIKWAGTFFCLIGEKTHDSEWVDWEIRQAAKEGKQIIGVYCLGATDADVPEALNEFADSIVGWKKNSIESAMSGEHSFENADGSTRASVTSARSQC